MLINVLSRHARWLAVQRVENGSVFGAQAVVFADVLLLGQSAVQNVSEFGAHTIAPVVYTNLSPTRVTNVNQFGAHTIALFPAQLLAQSQLVNDNQLGAHAIQLDATESYETPSYANVGGTGDREAIITVTTNASLGGSSGPASRLVDGDKANNAASACWVNTGQTVAMEFKFALPNKAIITEAKWFQNGTSAQPGAWKWQGSNNDVDYTDLSTTFTLNAGSTGAVIGDLSANATGYLYYKLLQTTVAGGNSSPWLWECEFKIGNLL
jgi:hypothetical protein